jgi:hypothetical protein
MRRNRKIITATDAATASKAIQSMGGVDGFTLG